MRLSRNLAAHGSAKTGGIGRLPAGDKICIFVGPRLSVMPLIGCFGGNVYGHRVQFIRDARRIDRG
ncbi:MAG TPA: hypothetical protein VHY10_08830, partial [Xanthobacteraceae bacterium]|nr:hypothetical protein [Xanthobacteraceae bacterium]